MTTKELNAFRTALDTKLTELQNGNRSRAALAIESSPDETDRIQNSQERDAAIRAMDRNAALLSEVRDAISRATAGTFGVCLDCEENISMKRLAALPWASSCIVCRAAADNLAAKPWMAGEPLYFTAS